MGFHIVCPQAGGGFFSRYVERLEEMAMIDEVTPDALIYEGEKRHAPWRLGTNPEASKYILDWYCAGMRAQELFRELALDRKLIVEEISQDQESFKPYVAGARGSVKRGDFLIRNAKNIEVEVKCRSLNLRNVGSVATPYYRIGVEEVKKLDAMQRITGIPILVAFFERSGRNPMRTSMKMISISTIIRAASSRVAWSDDRYPDWCVPLSLMQDQFTLIDRVRESIVRENEVGGTWDAILNASREVSAREILTEAQDRLCVEQGTPLFMPRDGICFSCRGDVIGHLGIEITKKVVTGCPICCRTFCD